MGPPRVALPPRTETKNGKAPPQGNVRPSKADAGQLLKLGRTCQEKSPKSGPRVRPQSHKVVLQSRGGGGRPLPAAENKAKYARACLFIRFVLPSAMPPPKEHKKTREKQPEREMPSAPGLGWVGFFPRAGEARGTPTTTSTLPEETKNQRPTSYIIGT